MEELIGHVYYWGTVPKSHRSHDALILRRGDCNNQVMFKHDYANALHCFRTSGFRNIRSVDIQNALKRCYKLLYMAYSQGYKVEGPFAYVNNIFGYSMSAAAPQLNGTKSNQ